MATPSAPVTTLGRRLTLLIIGFSSLIAAFTTSFDLYYDYQKDRSELDRMLEQPPLSFESIGESLWSFDDAQIKLSIKALSRMPNVVYVKIIDDSPQTRVWETGKLQVKHYVERHFPLHYASRTNGGINSTRIGSLTVIASLDPIHQRILSRAGIVLAGNFMKTLLVAAFMLLLFRRMITERITALSRHIQDKVSPLLNDTATPLPESGNSSGKGIDEIEALGATFDQLCRLITDQNASLAAEVSLQTDKLSRSEQRFRSFVENVNDVLFALTPVGVFTYVSPQWEVASGYTFEETIGQAFIPFIHPDDVPACMEFLQQVISTGEKMSGVEYRVHCKNGDYVWYRANASRIVDPKTGEPLLVGIGRDITQLKLSREALTYAKREAERASLAKTRFLAAASHDLRQPVTAITLFCDSLSQTTLTEEQQLITHYLAQASANMRNLLESLLDVSMLDTGRLNPRIRMLPIIDVMSNIEAGLAPVAQAKSLRFKLFFPQRDVVLYSDEQLLARLLGNLVGNAIKYTERGGILVGVRRRGDHALFQVWDTGRGIALEHISDIFDEYFQVGNPERDVGKGLGLGLSISMRLARLLGTKISCHSRPGRGSVFEFRMPLISVQRAQTQASPGDAPAAE